MWLNIQKPEEFLQIYPQIPVVLFTVDPLAGDFMENGTRYGFVNQFTVMERVNSVLTVGQDHNWYLYFLKLLQGIKWLQPWNHVVFAPGSQRDRILEEVPETGRSLAV